MTENNSQELSSLTHALRRHLRRRGVMGDRRYERWSADRAQDRAPSPAPQPAAAAPAQESGWPGSWGSTPDHKDETERRIELLRARAEACPDLQSLQAALSNCTACSLCQTRKQTVFMDGNGPARVMFVGEAPGYHEDQQGVPFVGPSGQLLTDIVEKGMGLSRSEVVIANVLKCRPPENRDPLPAEKRLCTTWLDRQIELVDPEIIIALGRHAAAHLLQTDATIGRLRGQVWMRGERRVVATYHPSYLLRSPSEKKACWQDIQLAMGELGLRRGGDQS